MEKVVNTNIVFLLERILIYWKRRMEQRKINIQRKYSVLIRVETNRKSKVIKNIKMIPF